MSEEQIWRQACELCAHVADDYAKNAPLDAPDAAEAAEHIAEAIRKLRRPVLLEARLEAKTALFPPFIRRGEG